LGEEFVVGEKRGSADAFGREINETSRRGYSRIRCAHKLQIPSRSQRDERNSKLQTPKDAPTEFGAWCLVLLWSLELVAWSFILASAVRAVGPWRDEQRNVILRGCVRNDKADRDAIQETAFAKVIADEKNQFVVAHDDFISGEQRSVGPSVGIRLHALQHLRLVNRPEFDCHPGGWLSAHRIEDVSGKRRCYHSVGRAFCVMLSGAKHL